MTWNVFGSREREKEEPANYALRIISSAPLLVILRPPYRKYAAQDD